MKIGNINGAFNPKMGTIKDKNGRDLVDAEEIKKRWKDYMEELYRKDLNEPDYNDGVVNLPKPDILDSEVKWALRSTAVNKASGFDENSSRTIQIPKGGCHQGFAFTMSANLEDPAVTTGLEKVSPHPNSQKGSYQRMC